MSVIKRVSISLSVVVLGVGCAFGVHHLISGGAGGSVAEKSVSTYVEKIKDVMSSSGNCCNVYDSSEQRLFTLVSSDSYIGVKLNDNARRALENECIRRQTTVTAEVLKALGVDEPDSMVYNLLLDELGKTYLTSYLATVSSFGDAGLGIRPASFYLFGKDWSQLGDDQLELLMRFCDFDDEGRSGEQVIRMYADEKQVTVDDVSRMLGVLNRVTSSFVSLKTLVEEELEEKCPSWAESGDVNVKLSINSQQQEKLQGVVDSFLSKSIDLGSTGEYVVNSSVVVVDSASNYITAFVPSRTRSKGKYERNAESMKFDSSVLLGDIKYLEGCVEAGNSSRSLLSVENENGVAEYRGLDYLIRNHFGAGEVVGEVAVNSVYSSFVGADLNLIIQVVDVQGNALYTYDPEAKESNLSRGIVDELLTDDSGREFMEYDGPTGGIRLERGNYYGIGLYLGSVAKGSKVEGLNIDVLKDDCISCVDKYYPDGNYAGKVVPAYVAEELEKDKLDNYEILKGKFDEQLNNLNAMSIESAEDREGFETVYGEFTELLERYKEYLPDMAYADIKNRQEEIRRAKSSQLIGTIS